MDFYYTYIIPNMSSIGRKGFVMEDIEAGFNDYVSRHWEHLCREAVSGNRLFGHRWGEASRWWGSVKKGNEIKSMEFDVITESTDKEALLIGECKWTNPEMASELRKKLIEKASSLSFAQNKKIIPVLFLKNRPKDEDIEDIQILYPEDIVRLAYGEE